MFRYPDNVNVSKRIIKFDINSIKRISDDDQCDNYLDGVILYQIIISMGDV